MHKLMRYADAQYEIRIASTKTPEYIRYYSMANLLADYRDYHAARFPVFFTAAPVVPSRQSGFSHTGSARPAA